jgi:hypothetical protein
VVLRQEHRAGEKRRARQGFSVRSRVRARAWWAYLRGGGGSTTSNGMAGKVPNG